MFENTKARGIKPTATPVGRDTTDYTHPAYGQISLSRVHGSSYLYGADYEVSDHILIQISTSSARRRLSSFRHHDEERIVEVALSPAQWAAFVSSMNVGTGVCATITRRGREIVPAIVPDQNEEDFHKKEVNDAIDQGMAALADLDRAIADSKLSATAKRELSSKVEKARRSIGSTQSFIRDSFKEFVQNKTEKMKANLHAYAESVLMGMGLKAAQAHIETATAPTKLVSDASTAGDGPQSK